MGTESIVKLFEPYANKIAKGGDGLIEGFNEIVYVMRNLKPFPKNKKLKDEGLNRRAVDK